MMRRLSIWLLAIALLLPLIAFLLNAFSQGWFFPQLIPERFSLAAWERIFSARSQVPRAMLTSTAIAIVVTLVSLLISYPAARALGLHDFKGKLLVELLIFTPTMVPPLAVGMGLSVNFLRVGLGSSALGVGLAHLVPVLPYVILMLAGVFANYDVRFEEQAKSLGAAPIAVFRYVTLPAVLPGVAVAALFAFLISWSQYVLTFLIGGGRVLTMPVLLFSAIPGRDNANIAALSLLFVLPALLALLLTTRYLSRGDISIGQVRNL